MQVRKAYKKSALQLHPDKALVQCRFSVKLGSQGLDLASRSEVEPSIPPDAIHQQWSRVHHSGKLCKSMHAQMPLCRGFFSAVAMKWGS